MKRSFLVLLAAGAFATCLVHADTVDPQRSQISFLFKQMNVPVEGTFRKFTGNVAFDPARPEASKAELEVDLNSIDTGTDDGDVEAKRKPWFNTQMFPSAKFVSTSIQTKAPDQYQVTGKLTIKGRTNDVSAPVTVKRDAAGTWFEGSFPIRRLQYAIGEGSWDDTETVADEVQVRFKMLLAPGTAGTVAPAAQSR